MSGAYPRSAFLADLGQLGLTQQVFADRCGLNLKTPYQWGRTALQPIPAWVPVLLRAWLDLQRLKRED